MPVEGQAHAALEQAEHRYRQLLRAEPSNPALHNLLGIALCQLGRFEEGVASYGEALARNPDFADAHNNLGIAFRALGRPREAEQSFRRAVALKNDFVEAYSNLGVVLADLGLAADAERACRQAITLAPRYAAAHGNLGNALRALGRLQDAEVSYRQAIALEPGFADAHCHLGLTLTDLGRPDEGLRSCAQALALDPNLADAHNNAGIALRDMARLDESERSYRRALALKPDFLAAQSNLGAVLTDAGRLDEAERCYRRALEINPGSAQTWSNLLWLLNFDPGRRAAEIFAEHREFGRRFHAAAVEPHRNARQPDRRLRIAYCSSDLRNHAVALFIEPVLAAHDRGQYEIFCYHNNARADAVSARLRSHADQWRDVAALSEEAFCGLVRADAIDILVDLNGHTAHNRLPAFARKPAPVQATWLGYLNTTGLDAIDYRITDFHACPPGPLDALSSEALLRLPDSQWCYRPAAEPEIAPSSSAGSGTVTFGTFTNPTKINKAVIDAWARLLARVPRSRLLVQLRVPAAIPPGYGERFVAAGIPADRLRMLGSQKQRDYLNLHRDVDIMLDTFPVTGGTTTCDSLWMGVPLVTLAGDTATSRGGASLLHAVGLDDLVAETPGQYLDVAAGLAADPARLAALRAGLRERMRASPLMDAKRFTRNLEDAYRKMWRSWCASHDG